MVVGILRLTLIVPGARSLKEKRHALRKIVDRVRSRYNVSIAEVGENDVWQRAVLGVTTVANDHSFVNEVLDKIVRDVNQIGVAELVGREMEIETYSEMHERPADKPRSPEDLGEEPERRAAAEEGPSGYLREDDLLEKE
jgi:uncharacterized protein YlxP (DUF503 family)